LIEEIRQRTKKVEKIPPKPHDVPLYLREDFPDPDLIETKKYIAK